MGLSFYNSLTREKAPFVPADPRRVTMYVCGPTVWSRAHIGNARPAVVFDLLQRLLRHIYGAQHVVYARNITDVDDKINAAALAQGVDIAAITGPAECHYLADMAVLGVTPPDVAPHATHHIADIIAMVKRLIDGGSAYVAEAHVLFAVDHCSEYGVLSRRPLDEMIAGARVDVAPYKRHPADFVLWKPSAEDQPGWDSPWGRGRPGWHIECSAMIKAVLGDTIDIHGGGQDLIFPHHENELAQSLCANHQPLARVWLHNGMLSMDAEKMSKSLGNVILLHELVDKGVRGEVIRLALLSAHYRQPLDWTSALVDQCQNMLDRWYGLLRGEIIPAGVVAPAVQAALEDDLNTPLALARLAELAKNRDLAALQASARLMGLLTQQPEIWFTGEREDIVAIEAQIVARQAAKAARDFATADAIRAALKAQGILLEDGPQGTIWKRA